MPRHFVPFGTHWAMGIEVPYSLGVVDGGAFWSCGQCPLDLRAEVLAPDDLEDQLAIVADLIGAQFAPHGIGPRHIAKLVVYVAGDGAALAASERFLKNALAPVPLVIAVGVPPFYYPGMRVEIDVYGAEDEARSITAVAVRSGDLIHVACPAAEVPAAMADAAVTADRLLTARLAGATADAAQALARFLAIDPGSMAMTAGAAATADLVFAASAAAPPVQTIAELPDGTVLTCRAAGRYVSLLGRSRISGQSLAGAARSIMEAFRNRLAAEGLGFADVVKQQTFYVGGANAEDLYANMRVRNGYYSSPGPASTGLAVTGFADPATRLSIEVIARRR